MQKKIESPSSDRLLVDWFSMTSRVHSVESMMDLIGIDSYMFEYVSGLHGFQHCMLFSGIRICYNDDDFTGLNSGFVWLEMSGQGCRSFETFGNGDFEKLFELCRSEAGKEEKERNIRITRIDIAFDDMSGVFDINNIFEHTRNEWFVSRMSKFNYYGGSDGLSATFGSKSSQVFIRFYDKASERGYTPDEVPHWIRCEIMLKGCNALGFLLKLNELEFRRCFLGILKNYLSFRIENLQDSNKRRWEEPSWWSEFLDNAVAISVWEKPGVDYNLTRAENYFLKQPLGTAKTLLAIHGEKAFVSMIANERMPKNPKYQRLIKEAKAELRAKDEKQRLVFESESEFIKEVNRLHSQLDVAREKFNTTHKKEYFDLIMKLANELKELKDKAYLKEFEED